MAKQIVWVIGSSAAGKETFTRKTTNNESVAAKFGWKPDTVVVSPASVEYIAQSPDDPIVHKRELILTQVPRLLEVSGVEVVLNKWQFVDTKEDRLSRLARLLPGQLHRAIILKAPEEELEDRLPRKAWWSKYGSASWIQDEALAVDESVKQIPESFEILHVNSGENAEYSIL